MFPKMSNFKRKLYNYITSTKSQDLIIPEEELSFYTPVDSIKIESVSSGICLKLLNKKEEIVTYDYDIRFTHGESITVEFDKGAFKVILS